MCVLVGEDSRAEGRMRAQQSEAGRRGRVEEVEVEEYGMMAECNPFWIVVTLLMLATLVASLYTN